MYSGRAERLPGERVRQKTPLLIGPEYRIQKSLKKKTPSSTKPRVRTQNNTAKIMIRMTSLNNFVHQIQRFVCQSKSPEHVAFSAELGSSCFWLGFQLAAQFRSSHRLENVTRSPKHGIFGPHPSLVAVFSPAQTNHTREGKHGRVGLKPLNGAYGKAPLDRRGSADARQEKKLGLK